MHFCQKTFALMKTSDIFVENLINKQLLLAAFYQLTYQHDCKDFNICNYISLVISPKALRSVSAIEDAIDEVLEESVDVEGGRPG